jgi:alcohol dehydrogenase class IV
LDRIVQKRSLHISAHSVTSVSVIPNPAVKQGFVEYLQRQLASAGISAQIEMGIKPEPTVANVAEVHNSIGSEPFDVYIGLGEAVVWMRPKYCQC